jgi:serine kinase of HPr protein (carbohydrate metabolism regulator)
MTRVLITGMSGTGKSTPLDELATRGHRTVDTDYGDYYELVDGESLWRADRIEALLGATPPGGGQVLFVQGPRAIRVSSIRGSRTSCPSALLPRY